MENDPPSDEQIRETRKTAFANMTLIAAAVVIIIVIALASKF
jgi:hypothetical protein